MPASRRSRGPRRGATSNLLVGALAVAAAAGAATAHCHPTGTRVVDPLYSALFAAAVTVAASRASRWTWLVLTGLGVVLARGWLLVPAVAALGGAFASAFDRRRRRRIGALIGAVGIQVVLRWPSTGFDGLTALVAAAAVLPVLVSCYVNLRQRTRRWLRWVLWAIPVVSVILAAPAALGALHARRTVSAGIAQAINAGHGIGHGHSQAVTNELDAAHSDFVRAHHQVAGPLTVGSLLVPVVAQQRTALAEGTEVGQHLSAVAATEAPKVNLSSLMTSGGQVDIAALRALRGPVRQVNSSLNQARARLGRLRSPWLISPISGRIDRLRREVRRANRATSLANQTLPVLPAMLGADGTRRYFIAFMNPSESRGLDGFIGAFGVLRVADGRISLIRSGPTGDLNVGIHPGSRRIVGEPGYMARYGAFDPAEYPQDLTYSPNFPTVAQVISQIYRQSADGTPIDGVLALDPYALADLLTITGPITVPGLPETLTSANTASVLLKGQYLTFEGTGKSSSSRHDFLQDALRIAFQRFTSLHLTDPAQLLTELRPAVNQGRLLFWTDHRDEQTALHRLGLDGGFPAANGGDLLAVTTQNAGNNKLDAYIHQAITDRVHLDPATGAETATVTVTMHNDAPSSGLPPIVLSSPSRPNLAPGTDDLWFSLYSPLSVERVEVNGRPATLSSTPELGVFAYSQDIPVPSKSTTTVTVVLSGHIRPSSRYRLALWRQPLVNPEPITVQVSTSAGWRPAKTPFWNVPDRSRQHWDLVLRRAT